MESSVNSGACIGAITPLAADELDLVYGGKSMIQKIAGWIAGIVNFISGASPSAPPPASPLTRGDLVALQEACIESGGSASISAIAQDGSVNLMLLKADGGSSSLTVNCIR